MATRVLFDGDQYNWDICDTGPYGSSIVQGFGNAFDFAATLSLNGAYFNGAFRPDELGGRQLVLGGTLAGLDVTRRVYVPNMFGESWARFFESFTNNTPGAISVRVWLDTNYGSESTGIVATSSGNQLVGTNDSWVLAHAPSTGDFDFEPHELFVFGDGSRAPEDVRTLVHLADGESGLGYRYELTVQPGETVSLLYFVSQQHDAAEALHELRGLEALDSAALFGLTPAQLATVENWNTADTLGDTVVSSFSNDPFSYFTTGAEWGDYRGGFIGQTFVAQGNVLDEIRFQWLTYINGTGEGPTDYKVVVTTWADGHPGAILGSSNLLVADVDDLSAYRGIVTVNFADLALTPGQTYAFIVDANYGTLTTGMFGFAAEDGSAYAGGAMFTNFGFSPTDYTNIFVRNDLDLSFRLSFLTDGAVAASPVLAQPLADVSRPEDTLINYTIPFDAFTDPNDDLLTYTVTLANGGPLPDWLVFVPSARLLSGLPPLNYNGTLSLKVTASDGTGTASDVFDLVITPVNDRPYVFLPIPDQTVAAGAAVNFSFNILSFADHENTPLAYTARLVGGAQLPAWLSFDPATRTFAGTPPAGFGGQLAIEVTASDGSLSVSDAFDLRITAAEVPSIARPDAFAFTDTAIFAGNLLADNGSGADSDANGIVERIRAVDGSRGGIGSYVTLASGARVNVSADGTFVYDANGAHQALGAPGSGATNLTATDSFTYTLEGGSTATVTIRINGADNNDFLRGTAGADNLFGGELNDTLLGGLGADTLNGSWDVDTVSYADDLGSVFVNLTTGRGFGNAAQDDVYFSIENVVGSSFSDVIIGALGGNRLDGRGGNDMLIGALGGDVLIGGDGIDTASYADNQGSVFVNLTLNRGFNNAAQDDSYSAVENLLGGMFNDVFIGDESDNRLDGALGADTLLGAGGVDTFVFAYAPSASSPLGSINVDTILDFVSGTDKIELSRGAFGTGLTLGTLSTAAFATGTAASTGDHRIIYDQTTGRLFYDADGTGAGAAVLFAMLDTRPTIAAGDFVVAA